MRQTDRQTEIETQRHREREREREKEREREREREGEEAGVLPLHWRNDTNQAWMWRQASVSVLARTGQCEGWE